MKIKLQGVNYKLRNMTSKRKEYFSIGFIVVTLRDSQLLRVWLERAPGYNEYIKIIDGNVAGSVADPELSKEL